MAARTLSSLGAIGRKEECLRHILADDRLIVRAAELGRQVGRSGARRLGQHDRRVEHDEGGKELRIAGREIESDNTHAVDAVADDDGLLALRSSQTKGMASAKPCIV
jgi:hypothetical protein